MTDKAWHNDIIGQTRHDKFKNCWEWEYMTNCTPMTKTSSVGTTSAYPVSVEDSDGRDRLRLNTLINEIFKIIYIYCIILNS